MSLILLENKCIASILRFAFNYPTNCGCHYRHAPECEVWNKKCLDAVTELHSEFKLLACKAIKVDLSMHFDI